MKRLLIVPIMGLLVVTACEHADPTSGASDAALAPDQAMFSKGSGGLLDLEPEPETTGNHVVVFNQQRIPQGFAADVARLGGVVESLMDPLGAAVISGVEEDALAVLASRNDVGDLFPDFLIPLGLPDGLEVAQADLQAEVANENPAGAFFFARQWHLRAISAPEAWSQGYIGTPDVTVAILDTGIGYTHPDVDGLVDLSRSISFVPSDDALVELFFPGAHPVADLHWHGTHVAATVSSNAFAAAGVTSRTTLIGVKVCNVNGSCPTSGVLAGIMYAADVGADVMNLSLGGLFLKRSSPGFVSVIERAVNYANRQGSVIVVAAGNALADLDRNIVPLPTNVPVADRTPTHLPSLYASYCNSAQTLCISATGPTGAAGVNGPWTNIDAPSWFTNFGRSAIDVAAPGGNTGGSVWAACSTFSLVVGGGVCQTGTFVVGAGGTSMASPHAAGVAALLVQGIGPNQPGLVGQRLRQAADQVDGGGNSPFYGGGRINAARAVGAQ